jgi:hypothetical protein
MTTPDPGTDPFLARPLDGEQLALLRRYGQERAPSVGGTEDAVLELHAALQFPEFTIAGRRSRVALPRTVPSAHLQMAIVR